MWVKVAALWWSALQLSNNLGIHLKNGSLFCLYSNISLWFSMKGRDAFTIVVSCCDGGETSAWGIMSINVFVVLWVWVAGPSGGDVTTMLMRMLAAAGVLGTLTNQDRQSVVLIHAPDIHLNVMLYVVSSSDYEFTLLFAFLPFRNFCKGLWSLCMMMTDPQR